MKTPARIGATNEFTPRGLENESYLSAIASQSPEKCAPAFAAADNIFTFKCPPRPYPRNTARTDSAQSRIRAVAEWFTRARDR
jgi:hypothetical protein